MIEVNVMTKAGSLLAVAGVLLSPWLAQGHGFRRGQSTVSYYYYPSYAPMIAYYYPAPTYVVPVGPFCIPAGQPSPAAPTYTPPSTQAPPLAPTYAPPTAAPPSRLQSSQTSLSPSADQTADSRPYYEAYPVASRVSSQRLNDRSDVAFWNLTDRNRSEEHTSELQSLRHLVCRL